MVMAFDSEAPGILAILTIMEYIDMDQLGRYLGQARELSGSSQRVIRALSNISEGAAPQYATLYPGLARAL
jgi:hypothetical protein